VFNGEPYLKKGVPQKEFNKERPKTLIKGLKEVEFLKLRFANLGEEFKSVIIPKGIKLIGNW